MIVDIPNVIKVTHSFTCEILLILIFTLGFLQESTNRMAMSEESEGETAATTNVGVDGDGDSSAKRRLRNRRLNLNKLARDGIFNAVAIGRSL